MEAREQLIVRDLRQGFPLLLPEVEELGLHVPDEDDRPWDQADVSGALDDLARLHDHPWPDDVLADERLRDPLGRDLDAALERARRAAGALAADMPDVAEIARDPAPVLAILQKEERTLLHGDPWPPNVVRSQGTRVWIGWDHAAAGPAALDVATWMDQAPWALGWQPTYEPHPQAVDAASVFWLVTVDVPALPPVLRSDPELAQEVVAARRQALQRLA